MSAPDAPRMKIMEVCGTHTAAILRGGLRALLPPEVRLVSGPGCPVCVTSAGFIDGVIEWARREDAAIISFGDLFGVRGTHCSFAEARAAGCEFIPVYSPFEALKTARANPQKSYLLAAVGFETTVPLYALVLETIIQEKIPNLRLAVSVKTMPAALAFLGETEGIDGFLCPGHVSVIIGKDAYLPLSERFKKPFVIGGFEPDEVLTAIREIAAQLRQGVYAVKNLYPSVVSDAGNLRAKALIARYFEPADGVWRGIGMIPGSALAVRPAYAHYAIPITEADDAPPEGCGCAAVLTGRLSPDECPLFGGLCRPEDPVGACMVSNEGSCRIYYENR